MAKFKVGDKCVPNNWGKCINSYNKGAAYIEIIEVGDWYYVYTAKDKSGVSVNVKSCMTDGRTCEICYKDEDLDLLEYPSEQGAMLNNICDSEIKQPKKSIMTTVKNFIINGIRSADDKALIKAGMVNGAGEVTAAGDEALINYFLQQNKAAFVKDVVTPFLEEQKEESK